MSKYVKVAEKFVRDKEVLDTVYESKKGKLLDNFLAKLNGIYRSKLQRVQVIEDAVEELETEKSKTKTEIDEIQELFEKHS